MTLWTAERLALFGLLEAKDDDLGALYAGVVDLLNAEPSPGGSQRQLVVMCAHGVRELVNNLADVLGEPVARSDTSGALRALAAAWDAEGDTLGVPEPERFATDPDQVIAVRRHVVRAVANAVARELEGGENKTLRHSAAVLGRRAPRTDPTLRTWLDAYEWFEKHAHLDRSRRHEAPNIDEMLAHLSILEATLLARLRGFFDVVDELSTLLEEANRRTSAHPDASFEAPSEALVTRVLTHIGDLTHRRAFYSGLQNPHWVVALDRRDALIRGHDNPSPGWPVWPEGDYLFRMVGQAPADVAAVFRRRSPQADPQVRHVLVCSLPMMPTATAVPFVSDACGFLVGDDYVDHEPLVELIMRIADEGFTRPARKLADALYAPRALPTETGTSPRRFTRRQIATGIEAHEYRTTVGPVAAALVRAEPRMFAAVAGWLEQFQALTGAYRPETGTDTSAIWRPSIRPHEQNREHDDVGDPLVETLRELALERLRCGEHHATIRILRHSGQPLLTRVAIDAVAELIEQEPDRWPEFEELVSELLKPSYLDDPYRRETTLLARAALPRLQATQLDALTTAIQQGPAIDDDELGELLERFGDPAEVIAVDTPDLRQRKVADFRSRWRLRLLAAIGRPALPASLRDELDHLQTIWGVPDHPEFDHWHQISTGGFAAVDSPALQQMSDADILSYLREWNPDPQAFAGSSLRGQTDALEHATIADPVRFAHLTDQLDVLPSCYLGAVLRGIERAAQEHVALPWAQILRLIAHVAHQATLTTTAQTDDDDEPDRRQTARAAASLLTREELLQAWTEDEATAAVSSLTVFLDGVASDALDGNDEDALDSLTASLNRTRPIALRALARLACAFAGTDPATKALVMLDRHCGPGLRTDLAQAAVWGEVMGRFIDRVPDWITPRLTSLLGDPDERHPEPSPYSETVWSVFLASWRPHREFRDRLRPWFTRAVEQLAEGRIPREGWASGRDQRTRLGDHLVHAVAIGVLELDDPLVSRYFTLASTSMRAEVLGHLGWSMMRAQSIDQTVLDRALRFVSSRAEIAGIVQDGELDKCAWWSRVPGVEPAWWLPLIAQASVSTTFAGTTMLGEPLEHAAAEAPARALEVFERLLDHQDEQVHGRHSLVRHAPIILAAALDHADIETTDRAVRVRDRLGRTGFLELPQLIEKHRRSE